MSFKHMVLQPLTAVALLGFSVSAIADVTISVPKDVEILVANSQPPEFDGGIFSSSKSVTLPDGENQIVFRYSPTFRQGGDQRTIETEAIITKFTASDAELSIEVPQYYTAERAKTFDTNPTWKLVDDDDKTVEVKQDKLSYNGLQLGRDYVEETQAYNSKGGIAAITVAEAEPVAATAEQVPTNSQYKNQEEQMLHYWYEKADSETKQRFIQSVIQVK